MKNYYFLFLTIIISNTIFSQDKTFEITNESKKNKTAHLFEIVKQTIKTDKYEKREIDNPKYLSLIKKIDSLDNEIKNLNGSEYSEKQKQSLSYAYHHLKDAIAYNSKNGGEMDIFGDKWVDLRKAKKELDKTGIEFQQTTKKKYSLALEEAKKNMEKIQGFLGLSSEKRTRITKLENEKSDLERKINSPFNPIKKKIYADVAIGQIEREALIVSSENVFPTITGKFIAIKNDQYNNNYSILKEDYKGLIKNELVSKKTIEENIKDEIGSLKNLNRLTEDVATYIYRDKNDNSYLKYTNDRYLIKSLENDKLYLTTDNILDKINIENKDTSENDIEISDSDVKEYNIYYKQAIKMLGVVTKHRQTYNSGTMTTSRLTKWKTDLKTLISINKKMDDIHYGKYSNEKSSDLAYQYFMAFNKKLTREQVQARIIISDMIRECKIITGI